jgi:hypothetical protein
LDIPTSIGGNDDKPSKPMSVDALMEEIAINCNDDTLLILPEAKRLTTKIRYWLEDLINNDVKVVGFAVPNPGRDILLEMLEIELELPSDRHIREVMEAEALKQGLDLSKSRLAELQPIPHLSLWDIFTKAGHFSLRKIKVLTQVDRKGLWLVETP